MLRVALGAAAGLGVEQVPGSPVRVTPALLALGLLLSLIVGVAAGCVPARYASDLIVVEGLRDET